MSSIQTLLKTLFRNPSTIKSQSQAKQLHAQILKTKGPSPPDLSFLLSVYSNLNLLHDTLTLLNTLHFPPTTIAWISIIRCYASHGLCYHSLASLVEMKDFGICPDRHVFPSVLKSCTLIRDLRFGESVHGAIVRSGMDFDLYTCNALMNMYAKLEILGEIGGRKVIARQLLDESPEPNQVDNFGNHLDGSMELNARTVNVKKEVGVGESLYSSQSNEPFRKMKLWVLGSDVIADLTPVRDESPQIDAYWEMDDQYNGNIDRVSKQKEGKRVTKMDSVRKVFDMMPERDIVSWNTVIAGNAQNGMYEQALARVRETGNANLKPDSITLSSVLPVTKRYLRAFLTLSILAP